MRRGLLLQSVILLLMMLILAGLHCGYQYLKDRYETAVSAQPVVLFSTDLTHFEALLEQLENKPYIASYSLVSNADIAESLIKTYNLMPTEELLYDSGLPHMLTLRTMPGSFDRVAHDELMALIKYQGAGIEVEYNETLYRHYLRRLIAVNNAYTYAPWLWCGFICIVALFLRLYFLHRSQGFWKVYQAAGGHQGMKTRSFVIDTLWLCTTPAALTFLAYCLLKMRYQLECTLEPLNLLYGVAACILATLIVATTGAIKKL